MIYDPSSYEKTDQNLGRLIDRLVAMKVNTVFLQAFSDPEGTGNIKSVYFHNRVLPVKADIFSHAVHQMMIRDMTVYAWMPTLSIELLTANLMRASKCVKLQVIKTRPSQSWYRRLTPFDEKEPEKLCVPCMKTSLPILRSMEFRFRMMHILLIRRTITHQQYPFIKTVSEKTSLALTKTLSLQRAGRDIKQRP